jgi:hypothetical protein
MQTSCASAVSVDFDRALALLHKFWYARAFERFNQVAKKDPECAMAFWGAAMTYNHPFWDPTSQASWACAPTPTNAVTSIAEQTAFSPLMSLFLPRQRKLGRMLFIPPLE